MSDETPTTHLAGFGKDPETGIVVDMSKVPSNGEPREAQGSHLRSTGRGYELDDGESVAYVDTISGPHRG